MCWIFCFTAAFNFIYGIPLKRLTATAAVLLLLPLRLVGQEHQNAMHRT
jgi:hypothetical protein